MNALGRRLLEAAIACSLLAAPCPARAQKDSAASGEASDPGPAASDSFSADESAGSSELGGEETERPKLEIYGFADFTYSQLLVGEHNQWNLLYKPYSSFYVGNLNMYFASSLSESWRSLIEIRFTYLPHGALEQNSDGTTSRVDTTVPDYADYERPLRWGAIEIERASLEYMHDELLNVRVGQWLTPYGIWNVDHGSPTIIGVTRPFVIGEELFPERQTGIEVYGSTLIDSVTVGYHATLSNGRGPVDTYSDLDHNKALGGRLFLKSRPFGDLDLGLSAYYGRYTDRDLRYVIDEHGGQTELHGERPATVQFDELSLGCDLRWKLDGLLVQAEAIVNDAAYDDAARPPSLGVDGVTADAADYRRLGGYLLTGYRIEPVGLMPFFMIDYANFADKATLPQAVGIHFGLNLQLTPSVVVKAEWMHGIFFDIGSTGIGRDPLQIANLQTAWAF